VTAGAGSALERFLARLSAQRAFLARAAALIADVEGPVFEIGLGKARTYSHLRSLLPERAIYCFDRDLHAPAEDAPPAAFLVLGEIAQTVPAKAKALGARVALAHCDIGSRNPAHDLGQARMLAEVLPLVMAKGGIVVADRAILHPALASLPAPDYALPPGIEPWPYLLYRWTGT
jgi:S-adenosyl-L-methionine methyltransferase